MSGAPPPARTTDHAIRADVLDAVTEAVLPAFPELVPERTTVQVRWHRPRLRCALAALDLTDGDTRRAVVVKMRSDRTGERAGERLGRPRVAGGHVPAREAAVLEHAGLVALEQAVSGRAHLGLRSVRPLALLPDLATVVMDEVAEPTLKDVLQRGSRLRRGAGLDLTTWHRTGKLLAAYHQAPPPPQAQPWLSSADEIADLVDRLLDYLRTRRATAHLLSAVERRVHELLVRVADPVALAPSHGDFAPRNLFADANGAVALFDPMPGWQVPPAYDLATFVVELRLNGWQLASRGTAFDRAELEAREAAVLAGHGTTSDDPLLRVLVLLVLLDRWSWLVSPARGSGARGRLSAVKLAWLRSAFLAEVRRSPALLR